MRSPCTWRAAHTLALLVRLQDARDEAARASALLDVALRERDEARAQVARLQKAMEEWTGEAGEETQRGCRTRTRLRHAPACAPRQPVALPAARQREEVDAALADLAAQREALQSCNEALEARAAALAREVEAHRLQVQPYALRRRAMQPDHTVTPAWRAPRPSLATPPVCVTPPERAPRRDGVGRGGPGVPGRGSAGGGRGGQGSQAAR